jgi:hypothetical protein
MAIALFFILIFIPKIVCSAANVKIVQIHQVVILPTKFGVSQIALRPLTGVVLIVALQNRVPRRGYLSEA